MPRLLHLADVHLGARHQDMGPAAAAQRERQFAAFRRAIDLALAEKVDAVLISGDLFDSNSQPRRSVESAAAELRRLAERHIRTVLIPGTHDCYDEGSIYRVFDLPALAGTDSGSDMVVVLTDERPQVTFADLDTTVHGRVFRTKRAPQSPLAGFSPAEAGGVTRWQVGMIHGSLLLPGKVEQDDVLFTDAEVAASGLDYLALGHWHSFLEGRAGKTTWAYAGAPEPVAVDQDGAGSVVLVELDEASGKVRLEARPVGRTSHRRLDLDAAAIASQAELERRLGDMADADLVLDARLVGVRPDRLDMNLDEIEQHLAGRFLRFRLRDHSVAALPEGEQPPAETIPGAFVRDLQARIAQHEGEGDADTAAELREALRLGRLLLEEPGRVVLV
jgi:DNA repair exonuclease SbcCD nuclease subunit